MFLHDLSNIKSQRHECHDHMAYGVVIVCFTNGLC